MFKAHRFSTSRPSIYSFVSSACQQFCKEQQIGDPDAFIKSFEVHADGFENACNLNRDLHWEFGVDKELTPMFIEDLGDLSFKISWEHHKAVLKWAEENPATPWPVGTRVSFIRRNKEVEGTIEEAMEGHRYVINQDNYSPGKPVIPFEDVTIVQ